MDMGIKGRKAIVCAASKGLGKGCAMALAGEGVDLVINARTKSELEATADEIRKKHGVKVTPIAIDVTTDEGAPLEPEFEKTSAFRWLSTNAGRFGFALSYPAENPYGYDYEPWHWCFSPTEV